VLDKIIEEFTANLGAGKHDDAQTFYLQKPILWRLQTFILASWTEADRYGNGTGIEVQPSQWCCTFILSN
jgi:hypothetical protein